MIESYKDFSETVSEIKKNFYRFRNGIVADSLRVLYKPGYTIFGLNVPQFMELSRLYQHDIELALQLWNDNSSRECRLMSLYLLPTENLDRKIAEKLIKEVESTEQAEFLAFRVLRKLSYASELLRDFSEKNIKEENVRYCMEMLKRNLNHI